MTGNTFRQPLSIRSIILATLAVAATGLGIARAADGQPQKKDTRPFLIPKEVELTAEVTPKQARPGEVVTYKVTAKVREPWHIYAYTETQPEEGPRSTQFDFFQLAGMTFVGDWTASRPPEVKPEPNFGNKPFGSYEGEVSWSRKLRVPADAEPGAKELKCQVTFQICDPKSCKGPIYITLPVQTVTVAGDPVAVIEEAAEPVARAEEPPAPDTPAALEPVAEAAESGSAPAAPRPANVAQQKIRQGLIPFLLFSAGGGLLALLMPCVWPMVPITVNFFVKEGQKGHGRTTALAITYCLSIIAIFTLVGLLFSAFLGASSLQDLANTAWLNLAVAAIFIVFGLSLLGLFELRLPSFLLNASAQNEARGGLVGVIFMALTLTITSFTCTFPVVGGLLVVAASGSYLYPVIGLATFATMVALPFFLLALAPGLLARMPRSGDWMNGVKVVGGLIEIGAAFKFINTAELALYATPETAWFDVQVVLSIWVVIAMVCGIYLLGLFRTNHDHDAVKVGPVRMLLGIGFLCFSLYLAPALFGSPPQSRAYMTLVGLFPPDVGELSRPTMLAGTGEPCAGEVRATSNVPEEAERQEKKFHGVQWGMSYAQALETAKAENRPVLIDFTGVNCANCRAMEQEVMPKADVRDLMKQFVTVALYTDIVPIASIEPDQRLKLADSNQERLYNLVSDVSNPIYVALHPDGSILATEAGKVPAAQFKAFLSGALARHKEAPGMARVDR
jgi:thiol:disulfide interchange protein DsbD